MPGAFDSPLSEFAAATSEPPSRHSSATLGSPVHPARIEGRHPGEKPRALRLLSRSFRHRLLSRISRIPRACSGWRDGRTEPRRVPPKRSDEPPRRQFWCVSLTQETGVAAAPTGRTSPRDGKARPRRLRTDGGLSPRPSNQSAPRLGQRRSLPEVPNADRIRLAERRTPGGLPTTLSAS